MSNYKPLFISILIIVGFYLLINGFDFSLENTAQRTFSEFLNMSERGQISKVEIQDNNIKAVTVGNQIIETVGPKEKDYVNLLREKGIEINILESRSNSIWLSLLVNWGPFIFIIGFWIYMLRRVPGGQGGKLFNINKNKAKMVNPEDNDTTFKNVAGINEAKEDLYEIINYLQDGKRFIELGGKIPKGILMVGPPGNGKTLLARALAGEARVPFFTISGSDFVEMFVGVGAGRVRDLFEEARKSAPAIIFIDEIDAVGRHRGAGLGSGHDEREQTLNQLLVEMDGFDSSLGILVVAATNRVDILDPALLRPGRFDRHVHVNLPDIKGREEILIVHGSNVKLANDIDLSITAKGTPGFSGADLENLLNEAALHAARLNKEFIAQEELDWARDKIMMGSERKSMLMTNEDKRLTAYHEAGHAMVAAYFKNADPIHKITIIPRGRSLGSTSFLPEHDKVSMDKEEISSKIVISLGGRAAEELVIKDVTSGAEGDFRYATKLCYRMISEWGMSDKLGAYVLPTHKEGKFLAMDFHNQQSVSEKFLSIVDEEVNKTMKESYQKAIGILNANIDKLHKLAETLIKKETLSKDEFYEVIGKLA